MTSEEDRLRRELRAMGAVNRQLQAQLDAGSAPATVRPRRGPDGSAWIDQLIASGAVEPELVTDGELVFVIEGGRRRKVSSGLLAAALELELGSPRVVSVAELDQLEDGPPVEIFEAPDGPPFVVVGGQRRRVRGIPLPYPVSTRQASSLPEGSELNVAAANVSRRRYREALSLRFQLDRLRQRTKQEGLTATVKTLGRKVVRQIR